MNERTRARRWRWVEILAITVLATTSVGIAGAAFRPPIWPFQRQPERVSWSLAAVDGRDLTILAHNVGCGFHHFKVSETPTDVTIAAFGRPDPDGTCIDRLLMFRNVCERLTLAAPLGGRRLVHSPTGPRDRSRVDPDTTPRGLARLAESGPCMPNVGAQP